MKKTISTRGMAFRTLLALLTLAFLGSCRAGSDSGQKLEESPVVDLPLVSQVKWNKIKAAAPKKVPALTLWLHADAGIIASGKKSKVQKWKDDSGGGVVFTPSDPANTGPILVKKHGISAVHFEGKNQELMSEAVLGSQIAGENSGSLIIVMHQEGGHPNNDTIGWGGCGPDNRYNTHFAANGSLIFQMGNAQRDQISGAAPADWTESFHIVSVVRGGSLIRLGVDGQNVKNGRGFIGKLNGSETWPIVIAGACGNGFKGDIAEVLFFKDALSDENERSIVKYLSGKYRIALM